MISRPADTHRAAGLTWGRGAIVPLGAVAITAVMALTAIGIPHRGASDDRIAAQAITDTLGTAQTIFDRDRQLLNRMTDAEAAGLSDGSALPALASDLRAVALFDPAGAPLASASIGLNDRALSLLGEAVARTVAFHAGVSPLVVPAIGDGGGTT